MKRLGFIYIFFLSLIVFACRENVFVAPDKHNTIFVDSEPLGANIYLYSDFTGKVTPDSITALDPGYYAITLKLDGFSDTTLVVNLKEGDRPYLFVSLTK